MAKTHGEYEQLLADWVNDWIPSAGLPRSNDRRTRAIQHYTIARIGCYHAAKQEVEKRAKLRLEFSEMPHTVGTHLLHDDMHAALSVVATKPRRLNEAAVLALLSQLLDGDMTKAKAALDACKIAENVQHQMQPTLKR